jgi:ethanolamine utilization protein EutA
LFSAITMAKAGERFVPVWRRVTYESPILLTPYVDGAAIDVDALLAFVDEQYEAAAVDPDAVDCGAVILTGTALDRVNARIAADLIADRAGRFVAVSAGDALEATLAAHGSGSVHRSLVEKVLTVDIGGGTTKLALCNDGAVTVTAALDVGGRLVVTDEDGRIVRLEPAGRRIAQRLGITLDVGSRLTCEAREAIVRHMAAEVLATVSGGESWLLRSAPLGEATPDVVLSGGVAEYWDQARPATGEPGAAVGDLGPALAVALRSVLDADGGWRVRPAAGAIRATVLGAALFTVQLSGDTIHTSRAGILPLRDVLVTAAGEDIAGAVRLAARRAEPGGAVAIAVRWTGSATYDRLAATARAIAGSADRLSGPLVLVCDEDVGRLLGRHVEKALTDRDVVSIDGVDVGDLDFIDIAAPVPRSGAVAVTVKSLIFASTGAPSAGDQSLGE